MALATVRRLTFSYPGTSLAALRDVSLTLEPGEVVALLGPSGSGKSTLLRALGGLVPHFHGGRFSGSVEVAGLDTRRTRPADLAGTVATLFQDPEDQVVFTRVGAEVAFGLENVGTPPAAIAGGVAEALYSVGAGHLVDRPVAELSGGELQRVCLASVLALRPRLLLLDEPTSQLDPGGAEELVALARAGGAAVVVSEQRPDRVMDACDRVLFLDGGGLQLDAPREEALAWLAQRRPAWVPREAELPSADPAGELVFRAENVSFAYEPNQLVLHATNLELGRGEIVALVGPNGSGKTTLAKLAAGLLEPQAGAHADRHPRDLSSGERERLALAAVLVAEPDLLILDEPTRGVDPERKDELADLLRAQAAGRATLVVTNDLVFAGEVADRCVSTTPDREHALA